LELAIEENLILLDVQGPWNLEYIDHLHEKLLGAVSQVPENNYAVLFTPIGEAISVDAGFDYHLKFLRQGNARAIAINLGRCTTPLLTENLFTKLYRAAEIKFAFFDNTFDARLWLEKELNRTAVATS
jgi:hypothetical protein